MGRVRHFGWKSSAVKVTFGTTGAKHPTAFADHAIGLTRRHSRHRGQDRHVRKGLICFKFKNGKGLRCLFR
jgi:hypothetical protein